MKPRGSRPERARKAIAISVDAPASPAGMKRLIDQFTRFARRHRVPAPARHDLYIALDEIISNAVKHRRAGGGKVSLELTLARGALEARFCDNGAPFNPLTVPRPRTDLPLAERPIGGLGILLVRELMDAVSYARQGDRNCLVIRKKIG